MHCDVEDTESSTNKQHHLSFIHPPIARSCGPSRMALRGYMAVGSFLFLKEQLKGIIIIIITALCVVVTMLLFTKLILRHLEYYGNPDTQK
jgi:hypothetical protein